MIQTAFPSSLNPHILSIVDISFKTLQLLSPSFTANYLSSNDEPAASEGGEDVSLPQLAATIMDFLTNCVRGGKAKGWFSNSQNISTCIQTVFFWTQITREDVSMHVGFTSNFLLIAVLRRVPGRMIWVLFWATMKMTVIRRAREPQVLI